MADKTLKSLNFGGADNYFPLPLVTAADNDKILSVVNGEWAAVEAPSGGSGQYVWSKHETENGKILEYVIGETEADYPDGGWSDGAWYKLKLAITPYLSFIGNEDFTLHTANTTKNWDGTLEYSTDKSTWNTWDGTEISSSGSKLYLRGTGNTKITGNSSIYRFVFAGTDTLKIACEGNIENLLDYKTVSAGGHPTMDSDCYSSMFQGCTALTTAPELPATTLASWCYGSMFKDCTALTTAPALPATTLASYCYQSMFYGCTALTTAPSVLPATTLAINCYHSMFRGCTSLTTAPELPATTLAERCYYEMFRGCTSLASAPALPATTLDIYCYSSMFDSCASLTTAPSLPATTLAGSCYGFMFYGCSNIKLSTAQTGEYQTAYRIPKSGTGKTANYALSDMFTNTGGTFTGTPSINTTYYTSNTVV